FARLHGNLFQPPHVGLPQPAIPPLKGVKQTVKRSQPAVQVRPEPEGPLPASGSVLGDLPGEGFPQLMPQGGKVEGRVTQTRISPIDHSGQATVSNQHVIGAQIPVYGSQPERRGDRKSTRLNSSH